MSTPECGVFSCEDFNGNKASSVKQDEKNLSLEMRFGG